MAGEAEPVWKEFRFNVMDQEPEAEIISLLSQVMRSYGAGIKRPIGGTNEGEELINFSAIASWFEQTYR